MGYYSTLTHILFLLAFCVALVSSLRLQLPPMRSSLRFLVCHGQFLCVLLVSAVLSLEDRIIIAVGRLGLHLRRTGFDGDPSVGSRRAGIQILDAFEPN